MPAAWFMISAIAVTFLLGAWIGPVLAHRGVQPRLRSAPAEFKPAIVGFLIGCVLLVAAVLTVFVVVGSQVAAVVAALGAGLGLFVYERRYAAAAEAVRRRVA